MQFRICFRVVFAATLLMLSSVSASFADETSMDAIQSQRFLEASATSNSQTVEVGDGQTETTDWTTIANPVFYENEIGSDQSRERQSLDIWLAQTVTYSWVDISATGQAAGISGNDATSDPIPMGISFRWFGTSQTTIRISTNGFLTFNSTANTGDNTAIPNIAEPNGVFYIFWDDLMVDEAQGDWIKYYSDVTNNRFIVSWHCRRFGGTNPVNFQAIMNANGQVIYQYQSLDIRESCTVGMEDPDGTYGLQMCYNGAGTMPSANAAYRIAEPAGMPNPVTNLVATTIGTNVRLTWTNPTTDVYGNTIGADSCDIYQGATFVGRVGTGYNTFVHANTALGLLTYTVYAWNGVSPYPTNYRSLPTSVNINVSTPVYNYYEDFEITDGGWVPTPATNGWEWGVPTFTSGPTAHSGSKLWGTILAGNYSNNACYKLELAATQPVASTDAALAFWGWYRSEGGTTTTYDGCNLQISTDSGSTWQILMPIVGMYDDSLMTASNTCIGGRKYTWNGSRAVDSLVTGRWRYFLLPLSNYIGQTPVFQFTFGSDAQAANYPGFYMDDVSIWGLQPGGGATVSGTIILDGGAGDVTQATVRTNGFGGVTVNPNSSGVYSLPNVQLGQRLITAALTGYQSSTLNLLVNGDVSNANITLLRQPPNAPTGLTAVVGQTSGIVTLDWADSPDPSVDMYRVYRKRALESTYTLNRVVYGRLSSTAVDTLTEATVFHYVVTAVDTNVASLPVESAYSDRVEVVYGALPPQSLHARDDFDDRVRLTWVGPLDPPMVELSYDNGINSPGVSGIGFSSQPQYGWIAARFQVTGSVTVYRIRIYFTGSALIGDAFQVGLFTDNGSGRPTFSPLDVIDAAIEPPLDSFRDFYLAAPRTFTNGLFYVGVRQRADWPISIGGDIQTPFINNTFFAAPTPWQWLPFEQDPSMVMAIPLMHAVVQGASVQSAGLMSLPGWENYITDDESHYEIEPGSSAELTYLSDWSATDVNRFIASRMSDATGPREPFAEAISSDNRARSTLDDPDYYVIYRNGTDVGHTTDLFYNDYVSEGATYTYWITSHYASGLESQPSDTVTGSPAMAPNAPVVTGLPLMNNTMSISWISPTTNRDGSPCVDLDSLRIYRGTTLLSTVAGNVTQYIDAPPYLNRLYTWSVRAVDEASNVSPAGVYIGSVLAPWETVPFDWVELSASGTNAVTGNDAVSLAIPLGFQFPLYGRQYSQVRICTNGWLSFLNTTSVLAANASLPTTAEPNAAIYPFWDDLNVVSTSGHWVKYLAEPGRFVITWRCQQGTNTFLFEFQVILSLNGTVTFQYMSLPPTLNSYTLGLENAAGTEALQLFYNGMGDWSPQIGSAIQIFAPPPVFTTASGNVVFDGGNGTVSNVTISALGPNNPSTQPLANGTWSMDSVATGYQRFIARLTGYISDTVNTIVPDSGITDVSFTLRRTNPPVPTGFSASIETATQIVTLDWVDSPDLLVDAYRVYRKPIASSTWTLVKTVIGLTNSTARDTLVGLEGSYYYAVTALDTNVSGSPVESDRSSSAVIIAGHPAPQNLTANGLFDDRIRLNWSVPVAMTAISELDGEENGGLNTSRTERSRDVNVTKKTAQDVNGGIVESRNRGRSLDDVTVYRIYRDGAFYATTPGTNLQYYDTGVAENQPHSYYITAMYDDGQESAQSNLVNNIQCNLAPGIPTDFQLEPHGSVMRITWTDPTVNALNANGVATPCTDLVKLYLYRNNALIDSILPGVNIYHDAPPVLTVPYTWAIRARDEVPNYSASVSQIGIVQSPWQPANYSWVDISTTGTDIPFTSGDQNQGPFALGFNFTFYGQNYSNVRVCTNGWLTFGASTSTSYSNAQIPNTADPNAALYLFWDDLVTTGGGWVKYLSQPTLGRFIITWNARRASTDPYAQIQIIINSNGSVKYQYQGFPGIITSCTIGLENATGTEGIQLMAEGTTPLWTPTAQSAVEFWGGPAGSVEGVVATYTSGAPIPNCRVWAEGADTTSTVITDAGGHYMLRMNPGTYTLYFEHPNFCPWNTTILVEENIPLTQDAQMRVPSQVFSISSLAFIVPEGYNDSATFTIRNSGTAQCPLDYTISDTSEWLRIFPTSGLLNANRTDTIRVYVDVQDLPVNSQIYSVFEISYYGTGSPRPFRVDVAIDSARNAENHAETSLPTEFALLQCYPNPFNPTTQLRFDVARESFVDIVIYNIMGQEVAHPVSGIYQSGRYSVTFNAGDLPSGMYLVHMQSGEFSGVNKMMLLR